MASEVIVETAADPDALRAVERLWGDGLPAGRIAKVMNRHPSTIWRWLQEIRSIRESGKPPATGEWDAA